MPTTYKTIMLQIYKPSNTKRRILDSALERYTQALGYLLERYRGQIIEMACAGGPVRRASLLGMIGKDALHELNRFAVEPFKDSIKMEFAALAAVFIAQRRKNPRARFPRVQAEQGRGGAGSHPLYFGRYAVNRDYCLLYDQSTGRFYAKLYLLNAAGRIAPPAAPQGRLRLQYLTQERQDFLQQQDPRRYIVTPLAFGRHQLRDLNRLLEDPGLAHTARLKKTGESYYLFVNISCGEAGMLPVRSTMGLARSADGGLGYTVCENAGAKPGGILETGHFGRQQPDCQKLYLLAKSVIGVCRRFACQVVVESNGGRNDKLLLKKPEGAQPLTTTEYAKLVKILSYKLAEEGLPQPVALSANHLFTSCPSCFSASHKSRISSELFACVECGYASDAESVGSLNLVRRLYHYKNDCVPLTLTRVGGRLVFTNRILGFEYTLPPGSENYTPMYYALNRLVHLPLDEKIDSPRYAVLKKLRSAPDIREAVRIRERSAKN